MFKLKKTYRKSDYPWSRGHYWFAWGWFRAVRTAGEFRQGCALKSLKREERLNIKGRIRKGIDSLPDAWDDVSISRGRAKSWKDVSRKRKQWE